MFTVKRKCSRWEYAVSWPRISLRGLCPQKGKYHSSRHSAEKDFNPQEQRLRRSVKRAVRAWIAESGQCDCTSPDPLISTFPSPPGGVGSCSWRREGGTSIVKRQEAAHIPQPYRRLPAHSGLTLNDFVFIIPLGWAQLATKLRLS